MTSTCENIVASGDNPFDSTYHYSQKLFDQRILQLLLEILRLNLTAIKNPLITNVETYKRNPDSWVIEQIVNGSAEISSTSLIFTSDLQNLTNFTHGISSFRPQLYFKAKSLREIYNIYLIPFSLELWLCLITAFAFLTLALILILSRESKLPHKISYDVFARIIDIQQDRDEEWSEGVQKTPKEVLIRKEKWEIGEILLVCLGAICQQGSARDPSTNAARMLVLVLFVMTVMGYTAYSANIISLISLFPSTESELRRDFEFLSKQYNTLLYNTKNFKNFQMNFSNTEFTSLRKGFNKVLKGEAAFVGDRDVSLTFLHQQNYSSDCRCTIGRVFLGIEYQRVFVLKNNSKHKEKFNYNILMLKQSGLIQREKKRIFNTKLPCTYSEKSTSSNFVSFDKNDIIPVMRLFKVGLFASILLLIGENIVFHCSRGINSFFNT